MESHRVSLRDIARVVGKSHATVSMALRGRPNVSAKTTAEIRRVAERMGYRPDPMLAALAEHRKARAGTRFQATIAWINNFPTREYSERYRLFQIYKNGALERAEELGYVIEEFNPRVDGIGTAQLRRILQTRGIQNLIVAPHLESHAEWDFDMNDFSGVALGFTLRSPRLQIVSSSQADGSALAIRKLRQLGHQRIGLLIPDELHERTAHNFVAGFLGETPPADLLKRPWFLYQGDFAGSGWWDWFRKFKPDALLATGDDQIAALRDRGIGIPEDLSVVFLTGTDCSGERAYVNQRDREIGRIAVDTLIGLSQRNIRGESHNRHHILLEAEWCDGDSVRPRASKK